MRLRGRSGLNSILYRLPAIGTVRASSTSDVGCVSIVNSSARANGSKGGPVQPRSNAWKTMFLASAVIASIGSLCGLSASTDGFVQNAIGTSLTVQGRPVRGRSTTSLTYLVRAVNG